MLTRRLLMTLSSRITMLRSSCSVTMAVFTSPRRTLVELSASGSSDRPLVAWELEQDTAGEMVYILEGKRYPVTARNWTRLLFGRTRAAWKNFQEAELVICFFIREQWTPGSKRVTDPGCLICIFNRGRRRLLTGQSPKGRSGPNWR